MLQSLSWNLGNKSNALKLANDFKLPILGNPEFQKILDRYELMH